MRVGRSPAMALADFPARVIMERLRTMNSSSINHRELTYKAIAGLAGGALGWLPVELASHGHNLTDAMSAGDIIASYATMAILSGLIGGLILASDEQKFAVTPTVRNRFILGFVVCFLLAIPANYYSNIVFSQILNYGGWGTGHPGSIGFLVLGRVTSWMMMGTMLGAGVGIAGFLGSAVPSIKSMAGSINFPAVNIIKGAAGGWIGGLAGGLTFDLINQITGGGLASRLIGLSLIGLAIGLLIGLVQELTKAAWLTVDAGRLKGRQYRLEGTVSSIGRAEENPVGLFGDSAVQARHAVIEHRGNDYVLRGLAVADGTFLNGERIESATLHDGDRVRIGSYELTFHLRGVKQSIRVGPGPSQIVAAPTPAASSSVRAELIDASGTSFPVEAGRETKIGRATDNDIVVGDASVSRHHAAIESNHGSFRMRDLGSQNGTFVRGERVSEAALNSGDPVRVGDAAFTFRA
jgi:pSer/pThr/pTyr-binding forkhead associated (FHA) protein